MLTLFGLTGRGFEKNGGFRYIAQRRVVVASPDLDIQVRQIILNKKGRNNHPSISNPRGVIKISDSAWTKCEQHVFAFFGMKAAFFVVPS